jgi:hypothetical protein
METKALRDTLRHAGFEDYQIAILIEDRHRQAAQCLVDGTGLADVEANWPEIMCMTDHERDQWHGRSPDAARVEHLTERFGAVNQRIADLDELPPGLPKLLRAVVELAPGGIGVALWGKHHGILADLLKELEDKVDQPPA